MNEIEMNSNLKLKIQMDEEIICGQKMNVKITSKPDSDLTLNDLNIDIFISKDMLRFIKKNFNSDIFEVKFKKIYDNEAKLYKLNNNIIKINFKLKEQINLNENQEDELLNFDLNVKKRVSINESDIIFKIKIDENEEEFIKHVLVENDSEKENVHKIKDINVKSNFQDQKIQFDENVKNYKITVPHDQQYIDFELCESFNDSEIVKLKCVKLRKAGSSTLIKAGDYKIEVCRLENPEKSSNTNKSKKSKKTPKKAKKNTTKRNKKNHAKKNTKYKTKNSKIKNLNSEIKEILDNDNNDDSDEIDVFDNSEEKTNNKISSVKKETINTENKNNSKILIGSCIISLILIGVCGFLWKKRKNKN